MNFANSFVSQEQSNKERLMGVLYTALIGFGCISHSLQKGYLYTYTYVGLSALLVSDWQGNAKAYESWNEWQTGSTFFILYIRQLKNNPAVVARQPS